MPTLSLTQMVDLALGNPEVGAVNFNVLHTLFHAIIGKLNIGEQKADLHDDDKEFLTKKKPDEVDTQSEADSAVTGLGTAPSSANASKGRTPHVPYHALENKVAKLQEQLQALNELPTNKDLFDRATGGDGEKPRPVSDMWQNMQLQRRVGSNEDGVKKLMSLVEDMMGDMQKLRDQNEELQKQLEKALEDIKPADNNKHELIKNCLDSLNGMTLHESGTSSQQGTNGKSPQNEKAILSSSSCDKNLERHADKNNGKINSHKTNPKRNDHNPNGGISPESGSKTSSTELKPSAINLDGKNTNSGPADLRNSSSNDSNSNVGAVKEKIKDPVENSNQKRNYLHNDDTIADLLKRLKDLENEMGDTNHVSNSEEPDMSTDSCLPYSSHESNIHESDHEPCSTDPESDANSKINNDQKSSTKSSTEKSRSRNALNDKMSLYPSPDTFNDFVTWTSLEDALKGLRDNLAELQNQPERVVIEMSSQTDAASRPASSRSRASTPGPSEALIEILEKLGRLSDGHDKLEERVTTVEEDLKNKVDKGALEGLEPVSVPVETGVPEELINQLKELQEQLEALKKDRVKNEHETNQSPLDLTEITSEIERLLENLKNLEANHSEKLQSLETQIQELRDSFLSVPLGSGTSLLAQSSCSEGNNGDKIDNLTELDGLNVQESDLDPERLAILEEALRRQAIEFNEKVKLLSQDANRQLKEAKENLNRVENDMQKIYDSIASLMEGMKRKDGGEQVHAADSDALSRMQQAILQLQAEIERISNTTQQLIDDNNNNKSNIESIFGHCSKLEENKADKEFVQTEVEVKADKRHLDGKVNRSLFDSTCDELNKMINDILAKLAGNEDEWKKLLGQLSDDLDGKLDRLEFGPIKDELERQLKALLKRLNSLHSHGDMDEDDAAGLRKQLVQRFHCISCDRPVDMAPQGPIPSIPETKGLPATRSTRPYTTFELDTIRQHAKSGQKDALRYYLLKSKRLNNFERALLERQVARCRMHDFRAYFAHFGSDPKPFKRELGPAPQGQTQIDIMDLYATQRQCGGSHTMTYPHRRMTRLAQMNSFFREDDVVPTYKEEQEICGADGHVYKGRHDQNKLPNLQGSSPKSARKGGSGPRPPTQASAHSPRPVSARGASRSVSVRDDRPQSAQRSRDVTTEVPTGRGYSTPPPAPAPSEPDPQDTARSPSPTPATVEQVA